MHISEFEHFRDLLLERRQLLTEWLNSAGAMRAADAVKVRQILGQIKEALDRIAGESYGRCEVCQGGVELHRLEVQPITQICLDCFSDEEKAALEEDLYLASKIHRALLPQSVPEIEGFEVAVQSLAARNIGGDYYDFLRSEEGGSISVAIADAMGHGLPAGLLMSNLQGALRILSESTESPAQLLTRLNRWLCRNVPVTKFISMVCLCLDVTGGEETRVTYTNAGHCPPILIRKDGSVEQLGATGGVLGVHEDFAYEEGVVTLFPGDSLTLYTDGIIEARNAGGEFYDENRLIEFIRSRRTDSFKNVVRDLIKSVMDFSGTTQAADDLTAIVLLKK